MIDALADPDRPHMARGTHIYRGTVFVVSPHIPRVHAGFEIVPKPPAVRWLLRLVPRWLPRRWRPRWYRVGAAIKQEPFIWAAGKLFCTPAGFDMITHFPTRGAR